MNSLYKTLIGIGVCFFVMLLFTQCSLINKMTGKESKGTMIKIETSTGDIRIRLYDATPLHRDNFVKLSKSKYYDGVIFHRVIKDFMIQTGDPASKNPKPEGKYGSGGPGYTVPAEFIPELFHKKGAVSAARMGDNVNPLKESSGSQFYIVVGKVFTVDELKIIESNLQHANPEFKFSEEAIQAYTTIGGTPHLDGSYTVFGEVVEGISVVEEISKAKTNQQDRPVNDIVINKIK